MNKRIRKKHLKRTLNGLLTAYDEYEAARERVFRKALKICQMPMEAPKKHFMPHFGAIWKSPPLWPSSGPAAGYKKEQNTLRQSTEELRKVVASAEAQAVNIQSFLKIVKKYTEPTELTPALLREFVETVVVHAPDKSSGHRVQRIDVHYNFIGEIDFSPEYSRESKGQPQNFQRYAAAHQIPENFFISTVLLLSFRFTAPSFPSSLCGGQKDFPFLIRCAILKTCIHRRRPPPIRAFTALPREKS